MAAPLWSNTVYIPTDVASYWASQTFLSGTTKVSVDPAALRGSMATLAFSRDAASGVREDVAEFTFHLGIQPGASTYASLTAGQAAAAETPLLAWWTTMKAHSTSHWILKEIQWRDFGADFPLGKTGLSKPGPTWRVTAVGVAGTGSINPNPDQTSATVTFMTASRKHWGRIYAPATITSNLTAFARFSTAYCDALAGASRTLLNSLNGLAAQTDVMIWSPKYRGANFVRELQVDDTPDVVRRRRAKQTTYRKQYTS